MAGNPSTFSAAQCAPPFCRARGLGSDGDIQSKQFADLLEGAYESRPLQKPLIFRPAATLASDGITSFIDAASSYEEQPKTTGKRGKRVMQPGPTINLRRFSFCGA